jgi:hypothetical protein
LPFAPLLPFKPMEVRGNGGRTEHYGLRTVATLRLERKWHRAAAAGRITVLAADELCCELLRMHPAEVYGDLWWEFE